jgi:hypothetical protein
VLYGETRNRNLAAQDIEYTIEVVAVDDRLTRPSTFDCQRARNIKVSAGTCIFIGAGDRQFDKTALELDRVGTAMRVSGHDCRTQRNVTGVVFSCVQVDGDRIERRVDLKRRQNDSPFEWLDVRIYPSLARGRLASICLVALP